VHCNEVLLAWLDSGPGRRDGAPGRVVPGGAPVVRRLPVRSSAKWGLARIGCGGAASYVRGDTIRRGASRRGKEQVDDAFP